MRESKIEAYLCKRVKALGGMAWKFASPNLRGVPDRIVMLPGGVLVWVELKAPRGVVAPHQARRHSELWSLGQRVSIPASIEAVDLLLESLV